MQMYDRLGKIGEGTHGAVFKARNKISKEVVAIKPFFMDSEIGVPASALREICTLKQLCHPNVVRLIDLLYDTTCVGTDNGYPPPIMTLVYEYCNQDLKYYCDSISACGRQIDPSCVRFYVMTSENKIYCYW